MKNLRRMLSVMIVLLFSCILFVGCGGEQGIDETRQYVIFTVSKDRPGEPTEEDTYKVDSDALKEVQYEYDPEVTYSIRADVYYVENDEPTGAYKRGDYYVRNGDDIGETTMYMEFCYNGKYTDAKFTLEVIRTPVTPEVRFDPNGAISYKENESYTYEYDGASHRPIIKLYYNDEEIELKGGDSYVDDCVLEGGDGSFTISDYVGTYLLRYVVGNGDYVNEDDNNGRFTLTDITIKVIIIEREVISEGETISNVTIGSSKTYAFSPTHNGDYKFSYSSTDIVDFNIRNDNFVKLYSSDIGEQGSYTEYYEAGKVYYIEVNGYVDNTQVSISMSFSPLVTEGRSIAVSNISDYNIVKFVPQVSGQYTPTIIGDGALVTIYNAGGTDVTNQKLTKGNAYYIVIRNAEHDTGRLEITLSCDRLYNNVQYSVKSGSNSVAFIAPITGTYSFSGLTAYMVFGSDYNELYNQNSNKINLVANETYYVEFSSSDAENYITIKFDPVDLPESGNIILNSTSYFEINVSEDTQYSFSARSFAETNILLQLYNADLELVDSADNNIILDLSAGKYYLKVNVENIDTMLTIRTKSNLVRRV